jgi:hypothetical protein
METKERERNILYSAWHSDWVHSERARMIYVELTCSVVAVHGPGILFHSLCRAPHSQPIFSGMRSVGTQWVTQSASRGAIS